MILMESHCFKRFSGKYGVVGVVGGRSYVFD